MTVNGSASIAEWIAAVGTAAGFLAAAGGFLYDRYQHRKSERYAQARLVDGWLGETEFGERIVGGCSRRTMKLIAYVSNASHAAVRDVRFEIRPNPSAERPVFEDFFADAAIAVPPMRDEGPFMWSDELTAGVESPDDADFMKSSLRGYLLWIRFTDTAGQRWVRHPDGRLEETSDVGTERKAEETQRERRFPGYAEARLGSATPEEALEKLRKLKGDQSASS